MVSFVSLWSQAGPWPPLGLSVIVAVVTLVLGMMLLQHGASMSSSRLLQCSVTGLLIGLAMLVVLPQAHPYYIG